MLRPDPFNFIFIVIAILGMAVTIYYKSKDGQRVKDGELIKENPKTNK